MRIMIIAATMALSAFASTASAQFTEEDRQQLQFAIDQQRSMLRAVQERMSSIEIRQTDMERQMNGIEARLDAIANGLPAATTITPSSDNNWQATTVNSGGVQIVERGQEPINTPFRYADDGPEVVSRVIQPGIIMEGDATNVRTQRSTLPDVNINFQQTPLYQQVPLQVIPQIQQQQQVPVRRVPTPLRNLVRGLTGRPSLDAVTTRGVSTIQGYGGMNFASAGF